MPLCWSCRATAQVFCKCTEVETCYLKADYRSVLCWGFIFQYCSRTDSLKPSLLFTNSSMLSVFPTDPLREMRRDMTKPTKCVPSKDSDQPGHPPSLISLRCAKDPAVAKDPRFLQADSWAHTHFVGFVMSWLRLFRWFLTFPLAT